MHRSIAAIVLAGLGCALNSGAAVNNLVPNGDIENEFVNLVRYDKGYATHIEPRDTGVPAHWQLTGEGGLCRAEKHTGNSSLRLEAGAKAASAAVLTDYWRVKDPSMPFGLPLLPEIPVHISFHYKTSPGLKEGALIAVVTLGAIDGLGSDTQTVPLGPSEDWTEQTLTVTPDELRWGARIAFTLEATGDEQWPHQTWIDDVSLIQDIGDRVNLAYNPSFEEAGPQPECAAFWDVPIEDQWVSWVGARYRPARRVNYTSVSGRHSMHAAVTHGDVSGFSQEIRLDQDGPRLILFDLCAKLNNNIGNTPTWYVGPDTLPNLTIYVFHTDGTMQEVSPTFCLGESDQEWERRRGGFLPQKPVRKIRLQATLVGSEPTTSLWVDDVRVFEAHGEDGALPPSARYAPSPTLFSVWGNSDLVSSSRVSAFNDDRGLTMTVPRCEEALETLIYLNPFAAAPFMDYRRFYYTAVRITESGGIELGAVAEKQGYTAGGNFVEGAAHGVSLQDVAGSYHVAVPFRALKLDGPPKTPIGFNVLWQMPGEARFWTGTAANTDNMGRLVAAPAPGIAIRSVRFGARWDDENDQSQDFVTHPPLYAGSNTAGVTLTNCGASTRARVSAGMSGDLQGHTTVDLGAGETQTVQLPYEAGTGPRTADFQVRVSADGAQAIEAVWPVAVPAPVEIVLDQEFYFPEESAAALEIHNRFRPFPHNGVLEIEVVDEVSGAVVYRTQENADQSIASISFPIGDLRINDLPVQDYRVHVCLRQRDGLELGHAAVRFGRIRHTVRRPLPPIETLRIDPEGRLIINDDFRFFPIVPSLTKDDGLEAIELGANVYRAYYAKGKGDAKKESGIFEIVDAAWNANAYTLTIGPFAGEMEEFKRDADRLLTHPGFLACYGQQFYYWRLSEEQQEYRRQFESYMASLPHPRLVIWGHHDSSFLYDLQGIDPPDARLPLGYCYTKIMGRPGPAWRNAPFLTLTEQTLNPSRFKLGEVNYYVSFHQDEVVPEHFRTYFSLRADDWRGVRNESYLAVIYGADGLYHYICTQKGGLQRLRGWFQELNFMWPVFVADDAAMRLIIEPADSPIEARLKEWDGKLYLLTANASEWGHEATVRIDLPAFGKVRKLFDLPGDMQATHDSITDTWGRYDAFVYEIAPASP